LFWNNRWNFRGRRIGERPLVTEGENPTTRNENRRENEHNQKQEFTHGALDQRGPNRIAACQRRKEQQPTGAAATGDFMKSLTLRFNVNPPTVMITVGTKAAVPGLLRRWTWFRNLRGRLRNTSAGDAINSTGWHEETAIFANETPA
jgi:hypothetical protein